MTEPSTMAAVGGSCRCAKAGERKHAATTRRFRIADTVLGTQNFEVIWTETDITTLPKNQINGRSDRRAKFLCLSDNMFRGLSGIAKISFSDLCGAAEISPVVAYSNKAGTVHCQADSDHEATLPNANGQQAA